MNTATTKPVLQVIIASSRPGRIGPAFATWFVDIAQDHGAFAVEQIDLADVGLPFFDELNHPRLGQYTRPHTFAWSKTIARGDAFVIVTPEYNYGYPAMLKNAFDYLCAEWADKAVGFLSYGGVSAGTRAVQQFKQVVTSLRMVPVVEAVAVPLAATQLSDDGTVVPDGHRETQAVQMLDELARMTENLRPANSALHAAVPIGAGREIPTGVVNSGDERDVMSVAR